MFLSVYGSPALQAAVGIDPTDGGRCVKRKQARCIANSCSPASPN